jgi:hypothetical protein
VVLLHSPQLVQLVIAENRGHELGTATDLSVAEVLQVLRQEHTAVGDWSRVVE